MIEFEAKAKSAVITAREKDLLLQRNLKQIELTNLNYYCGPYDIPSSWCPYIDATKVDYIALYDAPREYRKTDRTAIGFFLDDVIWNGQHGIF